MFPRGSGLHTKHLLAVGILLQGFQLNPSWHCVGRPWELHFLLYKGTGTHLQRRQVWSDSVENQTVVWHSHCCVLRHCSLPACSTPLSATQKDHEWRCKGEHSEVSGCLKERYPCNFNIHWNSVIAPDAFHPISSLLQIWFRPLHSLSQPCVLSPTPSLVLPHTGALTDAPCMLLDAPASPNLPLALPSCSSQSFCPAFFFATPHRLPVNSECSGGRSEIPQQAPMGWSVPSWSFFLVRREVAWDLKRLKSSCSCSATQSGPTSSLCVCDSSGL